MAAVQKRIVHKQFNSPIAMYSNNNIQQVLDRELKQLSNGTIGIDFKNDPTTTVAPSLQKSAVLRALEDEEREKTGLKRVAWPPPPQDDDYKVVKQPQFPPSFHHQVSANTESPRQVAKPLAVGGIQAPTVAAAAQPAFNVGVPSPAAIAPVSSTVAFSGGIAVAPAAPAAPFVAPLPPPTSLLLPSLSAATPSTLSPASPKGWKPVRSPVAAAASPKAAANAPTFYAPPPFESSPSVPLAAAANEPQQPQISQHQYEAPLVTQAFQPAVAAPALSHGLITTTPLQFSSPQQQYQDALQQHQQNEQQQQQQQQQQASVTPAGQYPGLITQLRKEAPITQKPSPVFASQPAAASFKGGSNMRGDEKWPPAECKAQAAEENEKRRQLALGPIFRPRRVNKDYTAFFEKNALNTTYPAYRMPPGTQHIAADSTNF